MTQGHQKSKGRTKASKAERSTDRRRIAGRILSRNDRPRHNVCVRDVSATGYTSRRALGQPESKREAVVITGHRALLFVTGNRKLDAQPKIQNVFTV